MEAAKSLHKTKSSSTPDTSSSTRRCLSERDVGLIMEKMEMVLKFVLKNEDLQTINIALEKKVLQPYIDNSDQSIRQRLGDHLAKVGGALQFKKLLGRLDDRGMETDESWVGMNIVRSLLWNYSDASLKMAKKIGECGLLKRFVDDMRQAGSLNPNNEKHEYIVHSAVNILYNCARLTENRQVYHDIKAVEVLEPFLKADDSGTVTAILLTLSYITEENQNNILKADLKIIVFLLEILSNAANNDTLRASDDYNGFTALEIITGIANIAVNQTNCENLIEANVITLLFDVIEKGGVIEKESIANALWVLASSQNGERKIREHPGAVETLKQLTKNSNKNIAAAVERVLLRIAQPPITEGGTAKTKSSNNSQNKKNRNIGLIMVQMEIVINEYLKGPDLQTIIFALNEDVLQPYHDNADQSIRQRLGDHLAEIGAALEFKKLLERLDRNGGMETEEGWVWVNIVRSILWNYSYMSLQLAKKIGECGLLNRFVDDMRQVGSLNLNNEPDFIVKSAVYILHNCARATENRQVFRDIQAVEVLAPFLTAEISKEMVTATLLTLSYITGENQHDLLKTDLKIIVFLLEILSSAANNDTLRASAEYDLWSAWDIIRGIANIAIDLTNRENLIEANVITLLFEVIEKGGVIEKESIANALWVLASSQNGKITIQEHPGAVETLKQLTKDSNTNIAAAVEWVLLRIAKQPMQLDLIMKKMEMVVEFILKKQDFQTINIALKKGVLQPYIDNDNDFIRQKLGDHLAEIGAALEFKKLLVRLDDNGGTETDESWVGMKIVRRILYFYSYTSIEMAKTIGECGLLKRFVDDMRQAGSLNPNNEKHEYIVVSAVNILYNCARVTENQQDIRDIKAVEVLAPFLKADDTGIVTAILLTLSYITEENQTYVLKADWKTILFLLEILSNAANNDTLRASAKYDLWSAWEIITGIANIAINQTNCENLIRTNVITLLIDVFKKGGVIEIESIANALCVLASSQNGKRKIREHPGAVYTLHYVLSRNVNRKIAAAVERVLLMIAQQPITKGARLSVTGPRKKCEYAQNCRTFFIELELDDVLFEKRFDKCYCTPCHASRNENLYYTQGEPAKDYVLPIGWCRFGLKITPQALSLKANKKWHVAYHGTAPTSVKPILECGQLLIPGDTALGGKKLSEVDGHFTGDKKPVGFDTKQVFVSPSIRYSGLEVYAKTQTFVHPETKKTYKAKVAFQLWIKPDSYKVGSQTVGATEEIDPKFSNQEIEWSTVERGAIHLYGLLIRLDE